MTDPEKIAESLRKFLMRRASVDATTGVMGLDQDQFGFYVYFTGGTRIAVHVAVVGESAF